ncbi:hypothetical protein ACFR9U_16070 [Halorientalis brevis]|uniref:Halobacterial output domain-containing protein n=1 Tax=Halorientalis brevis TaxID=1126241 RepID=A0ABD6CDZ3_9EURY|nr:hypothetical protein [Halorientalis brevis]
MAEFEDVSARYTLSDDVNIPSAFEAAGIEYLDVDNERLIAIFRGAVLRVAAVDGEITSTATVELTVFELPPTIDDTDEATIIIQDVIDQVTAVSGTSCERSTVITEQ